MYLLAGCPSDENEGEILIRAPIKEKKLGGCEDNIQSNKKKITIEWENKPKEVGEK